MNQNTNELLQIWKLDEIIIALDILESWLNEVKAYNLVETLQQQNSSTYEIPSYFCSDTNVFYTVCELFKHINEQFEVDTVKQHSDPNIAWQDYRNDLDALVDKYVKICFESRAMTIVAMQAMAIFGAQPAWHGYAQYQEM